MKIMKTTIAGIALVFVANMGSAQKIKEAEVPKAVLESFQKHFNGAKAEKWEKEDGNYEAEFDVSRVSMDNLKAKKEEIEMSALFSTSGELLESEEEIKVSALPAAVNDYISKNYAGYKIEEAAKITDSKGTVTYEAEVEKGKDEMDLIFDANGTFLKKVVEKSDEKDEKKN